MIEQRVLNACKIGDRLVLGHRLGGSHTRAGFVGGETVEVTSAVRIEYNARCVRCKKIGGKVTRTFANTRFERLADGDWFDIWLP